MSNPSTPPEKYVVVRSHGRRRRNGEKPVVWCVRETTPAATLVAVFDNEPEAARFAHMENRDAQQ